MYKLLPENKINYQNMSTKRQHESYSGSVSFPLLSKNIFTVIIKRNIKKMDGDPLPLLFQLWTHTKWIFSVVTFIPVIAINNALGEH